MNGFNLKLSQQIKVDTISRPGSEKACFLSVRFFLTLTYWRSTYYYAIMCVVLNNNCSTGGNKGFLLLRIWCYPHKDSFKVVVKDPDVKKTPQKLDLKKSWNWQIILVPATIWQILNVWPETEQQFSVAAMMMPPPQRLI